jgi:hypothetical protein
MHSFTQNKELCWVACLLGGFLLLSMVPKALLIVGVLGASLYVYKKYIDKPTETDEAADEQ